MLKRSLAYAFLVVLVALSARSASAATTATIKYIIPQGGDPAKLTFGAANEPLFVDPAVLACDSGLELHSRIVGTVPGTLADVVQVQMQFTFDGDVDVNPISGNFRIAPWNAAVSHNGNFWTIVFTTSPANPPLMTGSVSITDATRGFAFINVCIPGDPSNSSLANVTFTATQLGQNRVPPRFPLVTVLANPDTLDGCPNAPRVPVFVSGTVMVNGAPIDTSSASFAIADEYGVHNHSGALTLTPVPGHPNLYTFSFLATFDTFVNEGDPDGRHYRITINVSDVLEDTTSVSTAVVVEPCSASNSPGG